MNVHFLRQVCLQRQRHGDADTFHVYSLVVTTATVLKPKTWLWCLKDFAWEQAHSSVSPKVCWQLCKIKEAEKFFSVWILCLTGCTFFKISCISFIFEVIYGHISLTYTLHPKLESSHVPKDHFTSEFWWFMIVT